MEEGNRMSLRQTLSMLILVLLALSTSTLNLRPAHAAGTLYTLPAVQLPLAVGNTFTAKIQIANLDPFNAWDISVQTDPTVISPQSLTVTPNLLSANFSTLVAEVINCVNGAGTGCIASDGVGIAHSAASALAAPP